MIRKELSQIAIIILYLLWLTEQIANDTVYLFFLFICLISPLWIAGTTAASTALSIYRFVQWILSRVRKKPFSHSLQKIRSHKLIAELLKRTSNLVVVKELAGETIQLLINFGMAAAIANTYIYYNFVAAVVNEQAKSAITDTDGILGSYIAVQVIGFIIFKAIPSSVFTIAKHETFSNQETALVEGNE